MTVGRLDDAATEAEANLALIDALDMWHDSDVPFGVLTLVAIHRNDLEGARGQLGHASRYEPVYARALPPYLRQQARAAAVSESRVIEHAEWADAAA